jgi:hypothetical protein
MSTVTPSTGLALLHRRRDGGAATDPPQSPSPIRGHKDSSDIVGALTPSREGARQMPLVSGHHPFFARVL